MMDRQRIAPHKQKWRASCSNPAQREPTLTDTVSLAVMVDAAAKAAEQCEREAAKWGWYHIFRLEQNFWGISALACEGISLIPTPCWPRLFFTQSSTKRCKQKISVVGSERSDSLPWCWACHWTGKGEEGGRDTNRQLPGAFIQDAKYLLMPQATGIHVLCFQKLCLRNRGKKTLTDPGPSDLGQNPLGLWWVIGSSQLPRWGSPALLSYPPPDALTMVTERQGFWHLLPGWGLSVQVAAMGGREQPRLRSSAVTCSESHVAAEAGLYWSNASYVPGIAQGVQQFKFC